MSNLTTACPLDCYDACEILYGGSRLKGIKSGHTQGFLCPHMNHYNEFETIQHPRYKGINITMDEALEHLKTILKRDEEKLFYKGSGNFSLMQDVTGHFFASHGATLTEGTLCDGAGEAGILEGRGSNKNMPLSEIAKSDVVVFWGRDPHTTSSHLLPLIKDKKIIVIDPRRTKIANIADLHIQLKPHGDIYLAMLLSRFLHIENGCDIEYLEAFASEFEDYYELTQTIRIKAKLDEIDVTLGEIGTFLELIRGKKVAIVCGVGVQKYSDGADVLRAIDAFAVMCGLFGKEGCGVAYLGDSRQNIISPFTTKAKKVSKVNTEFSNYKSVFIQGANPLSQMPESTRVRKSLSEVENIIYFGLYENETSALADLVLPAKSFIYKNDVRLSYSHDALLHMPKQAESEFGISEYDLAKYLCNEFGIALESESHYIKHFLNFGVQKIDGTYEVEGREKVPYKEGFDTDDGEFCFLEEIDIDFDMENDFFLLTPKSPTSLNSQFRRDKYIYVHPRLGFKEGEELLVSSQSGEVKLEVRHADNIRDDCVLIYSGTPGVNNLTTSKHSLDGKCAIYQENKVKIFKIDEEKI